MSGSSNTDLAWGGDSTQSNDDSWGSSSGNNLDTSAVSGYVLPQLDSISDDDDEHGTSGGSGSAAVLKAVPTFKYEIGRAHV